MVTLLDGITLISVALFLTGFILVGIEMLHPGISMPGILGSICLVVGIIISADSLQEGTTLAVIVLAILGVMLAGILWFLSKGKLRSPIILNEEQNKDKGYISSSDLNYLLGKKGIAATDLRPSGMGNFDGIELDVISSGKYIDVGTKIQIYEVKGSKLMVKSIKESGE